MIDVTGCLSAVAAAGLGHGTPYSMDVTAVLATITTARAMQFVNWCSTGFKYGFRFLLLAVMIGDSVVGVVRACVMLPNCSAIPEAFSSGDHKFDLIWPEHAPMRSHAAASHDESELPETRSGTPLLEATARSGPKIVDWVLDQSCKLAGGQQDLCQWLLLAR